MTRSRSRGKQIGAGASITFRFEHGRLRRAGRTGYSISTGRRLVEEAAAELGLTQRRGRAETVVVFVVVATVVAVLVLLVVLVL